MKEGGALIVSIDNNKLYKPKSFSNIHCFGGYK